LKISSKIKPLLVIAFCALTIPLLAQQSTDGNIVLHVFVPGNDDSESSTRRRHSFGSAVPPLSLDTQGEEPIFDKGGPNFSKTQEQPYGDLSPFGTTNRLDNHTDRVKNLNYFSNFTPSVIPYKRAVAQNEITFDGSYLFRVRSAPQNRVKISRDASGEIFWGSFLVSAQKGSLHPLPSISPNQKILEIRTEPDVDLKMFKDSADNFSVKIDGSDLVRINMKIAVPSNYFNGEFNEVLWSQFDTSEVASLGSRTAAIAKKVQKKIGLSRRQTPVVNLNKLVSYFRDFQARPFPEELNTGDLYEQIVLNQIGVCRHRSLAFIITASSMGIPTRYVYNEAHAFVEILWPNNGWRRVDLGGAADALNAATNDGRELHKPGEDILPQPEQYLEEQRRMRTNLGTGDGDGPSGDEKGKVDPTKEGSNDVVTEQEEREFSPEDLRPLPDLNIIFANASVERGGEVLVHATLSLDGSPLKNKKIVAYLGPAGQNKLNDAVIIGEAISNNQGRIKSHFSLPPEQDIGKWELFLYYKGDKDFGPALSD